ncbi:MAG TPA: acyltransferase [Chitinophagaceae bacterium]|nr:acyltransferase [Chitinophagaceae bacterium]
MRSILQRIFKRLYKTVNSSYYLDIPPSTFYTNFLFQKVYRNNADVPHPVHYTTLVTGYKNIIFNKTNKAILNSFAVSGGCYIGISDGSTLEIGDDTIWAWNVNIQTANHDFIDRTKFVTSSVKIGRNCWIGGNVTILPGVVLGDNITVGANSVVTKSFEGNQVIAGVPAKVIRQL